MFPAPVPVPVPYRHRCRPVHTGSREAEAEAEPERNTIAWRELSMVSALDTAVAPMRHRPREVAAACVGRLKCIVTSVVENRVQLRLIQWLLLSKAQRT